MASLSENIKIYRKQNGLTQKDLAKKLGVAPTAVSAWELGRNKPLMDNVEMMANIFSIKKSLLLGEEIDLLSSQNSAPQNPSNTLTKDITDKVLYLDRELKEPRHSAWISHGESLLEEQGHESTISEPFVEYHIYERLSAGTGATVYDDMDYDVAYHTEDINHDLASWVWGDSMEPAYLSGEVALIKATGFDYDGAVYAVVWDGQTYIKKAYREENGLRLESINPKYSDKFAPYDEDPRVIGMVVGHFMPVEK